MARFRITTKCRRLCNGIQIEPGMTVEVVTTSFANPVNNNGGIEVINAFMRIYGIDIKKAGCLGSAWLDVERIG